MFWSLIVMPLLLLSGPIQAQGTVRGKMTDPRGGSFLGGTMGRPCHWEERRSGLDHWRRQRHQTSSKSPGR